MSGRQAQELLHDSHSLSTNSTLRSGLPGLPLHLPPYLGALSLLSDLT